MNIRYTGFDVNGIPRVWGEGPSHDVAEQRAMDECLDYLRRRPDTGPRSAWRFDANGIL